MSTKKTCKKKATKESGSAKNGGRPTVRTEAVVIRVLGGIMSNDRGKDDLRSVCSDKKNPSVSTWMRWVSEDALLQSRYVAAMQYRALRRADECVPIADGVKEDKCALMKANLRIRTRQWEIMRLANKVYGKDGVVLPPPAAAGESTVMSDPEIELRLKSLRDEVRK